MKRIVFIKKGTRLLTRVLLAAFLFLLTASSAQTEPSAAEFCGKLNAQLDFMKAAMATQPALANNEAAQRMLIAMAAYESGYNPTDTTGTYKGRMVSFGIFQCNYSAFQVPYDKAYQQSTGQSLAGMGYEQKLPIITKWAQANPSATAALGAMEYAEKLRIAQKQVGSGASQEELLLRATQLYCGDPRYGQACKTGNETYLDAIARNYARAAQCLGWTDNPFGGGNTPQSPLSASPYDAGPSGPMVDCPDINLSDAMNGASAYFNAASSAAARTAEEDGAKRAAQMRGKMENPLGSFRQLNCLDVLSQYRSLQSMLLGMAATVLNMLVSFVSQMINAACQYVVATISNVLNSVCIPMPNLPTLPGFGGPDRKTCNGLSLASLMSVNAKPVTVPGMNYNLVSKYRQSTEQNIKETITRWFSSDDKTRQ